MTINIKSTCEGETSDMVSRTDAGQQPPPLVPQANQPIANEHAPVHGQGPQPIQQDERDMQAGNVGVQTSNAVEGIASSVVEEENTETVEPEFPLVELAKLDDMVGRPRWVVPVLPKGELEVLLRAAYDMCKRGIDTKSEACQRFFREGLTISFTKVLMDDAVNGWKFEIQHCILHNCKLLIDICVCKLPHDWFPLLDVLAIALNPNSKFHLYNASRSAESVPVGVVSDEVTAGIFARPMDVRTPKGWLVDLVNHFGQQGGFDLLSKRFAAASASGSSGGTGLNLPLVSALIKPFGLCYEVLTQHTVAVFFMPIVCIVRQFLEGLTDDELKKESSRATAETKNDSLSAIIKALKCLVARVPQQEDMSRDLEMFRLKIILRLLKISSFNGKMNALNEVNKVITNVSYYYQRHNSGVSSSLAEDDEWLTADKVAEWIKENEVLDVVLRDSLHQPQYVEKLEKIVRFMLKERALTQRDLLRVWEAQAGKHEAIVKNVHELLAKLAWDFSPEQLDYLFLCFQTSWHQANKKQREKLLELIRRLAEDDKEGVMAQKVLGLLWNLARSDECPTDIMDQALTSLIKILDYSCSQERDIQKVQWIDRFVEELQSNDKWVLPALKQIREICQLFAENLGQQPRSPPHATYRKSVISNLQRNYNIMTLVTHNLTQYMDHVRQKHAENPELPPAALKADNRYGHCEQVGERLRFLRFLRKDGLIPLSASHAEDIWRCLALQAVFESDREACFKWFTKLVSDEPSYIDDQITSSLFTEHILHLDPSLLTEQGMNCFDRFFRRVNTKQEKLTHKRKGGVVTDDLDLVGLEYLWRVVLHGSDVVAAKGIYLLKDVYTNLGPQLLSNQVEIHKDFIQECFDRLRASHDNLQLLATQKLSHVSPSLCPSAVPMPQLGLVGAAGDGGGDAVATEATRMVRVLTVLLEYVSECDNSYNEERLLPPLYRASYGNHMSIIARFPNPGRPVDDIELSSHSNDTVGSLRRQVLQKLKLNGGQVKVELYINNDVIEPAEDKKLVTVIGIKNKTLLTAKLSQTNVGGGSGVPTAPSNSESSSDSSPGGSPRPRSLVGGPSLEAERCLPGVLLSADTAYVPFLLMVAEAGSSMKIPRLRDGARALLKLVPAHVHTVKQLRDMCSQKATLKQAYLGPTMEHSIFGSQGSQTLPPPAKVLYTLELIYTLLMPASDPCENEAIRFQHCFVESGGVALLLKIISSSDFLVAADFETRRCAYHTALKAAKFLLLSTAHASVLIVAEAVRINRAAVPQSEHSRAVQLQEALACIPPPDGGELMMRSAAIQLAERLAMTALSSSAGGKSVVAMPGPSPDVATVRAVRKLAWAAAAGGSLQLCCSTSSDEDLAKALDEMPAAGCEGEMCEGDDENSETVQVAREALEVLTLCIALCPSALEILQREPSWQTFIVGVVLACRSRPVRIAASDQLYLIATRCASHGASSPRAILFAVTHLFTVLSAHTLSESIRSYAKQSTEFFNLLCRLLDAALASQISLQNAETLLNKEVNWLKEVRECALSKDSKLSTSPTCCGEMFSMPDEALLEGHLGVARQLLLFMPPEKKVLYGSSHTSCKNLVRELMDDFIFAAMPQPTSENRKEVAESVAEHAAAAQPLCSTPRTIKAAYDLLVALCTGCAQNLHAVSDMLTRMYYTGNEPPLTEWEYLPPVGARQHKGFVGLKNGGATCYMNSVLQQLYMISPIFETVISTEWTASDLDEELEDRQDDAAVKGTEDISRHPAESRLLSEDSRSHSPALALPSPQKQPPQGDVIAAKGEQGARQYNLAVLKQVQLIFAHLAFSKLQFYVPRGFWKHFRLQGEPVNLREQHDALEFFNSLVDCLDEALKSTGQAPIFSRVLGGSYADQKICKDCPHRYAIEQPFTALNVDIRNHQHLKESLEQFVKGDLLEGANAYFCERCGKKVDTVKRLCVRKLPRMLAIQLKRFDYDWERECAIKFNDYFEFPRELDMEPYTVYGLARMEGELVSEDEDTYKDQDTKYRLVGVVVHSGQASGGHYYSYIQHRPSGETPKWYKFDDGDVSECKMDDEEEMKSQCFGGDYHGEVYDHSLKRMSYRRQKRWWNAYVLFYEQIGTLNTIARTMNDLSLSTWKSTPLKIPSAIEKVVRKQNVEFMHNRNQFSPEYFQFLKDLLSCNTVSYVQQHHQVQLGHPAVPPHLEELSMVSVQLAAKFLFSVGFRTKKTLRGSASEWYEVLASHLSASKAVRHWFAVNALFAHPQRFSEYLLESPSSEVRTIFAKILAFLAHVSLHDGPCSLPKLPLHADDLSSWAGTESGSFSSNSTVSDLILQLALGLLRKEVSENGRHVAQYFQLFLMYAHSGAEERQQLLRLNVLTTFMSVAVEEGPGQPFKYQYAEFTKLYSVISILLRCCDLSPRCLSSGMEGSLPLPNPYADSPGPLAPLPPKVAEMLYNKLVFVKKLVEENNTSEDTVKLLRYVCWENLDFSSNVLSELLWQIAYSYTYELRPYLDLLLHELLLDDSWQSRRIDLALRGLPEEQREGLLDIIQTSKNHYQKRAYQCIKMMVTLYTLCPLALQALHQRADIKKRWHSAIEWLHDELDRRPYPVNQQSSYNSWSPPAPSNESSNSYFLERSSSAKMTLDKALELCPDSVRGRPLAPAADEQKLEEDSGAKNNISEDDFHSVNTSPSLSGQQLNCSSSDIESSAHQQPPQPHLSESRVRADAGSSTDM